MSRTARTAHDAHTAVPAAEGFYRSWALSAARYMMEFESLFATCSSVIPQETSEGGAESKQGQEQPL